MASDTDSISGGVAGALGKVIPIVMSTAGGGAARTKTHNRTFNAVHEHGDEHEGDERDVNGINGYHNEESSVEVGYGSVDERTPRGSTHGSGS